VPIIKHFELEDKEDNRGYVRIDLEDVPGIGKLSIDVRIKVDDECISIDVYDNAQFDAYSLAEFYVPYEDFREEEDVSGE